MERSPAARIARLLGMDAPVRRPARAGAAAAGAAAGALRSRRRGREGGLPGVNGPGALARALLAAVRARQGLRFALLGALCAVVLLGGGWLWLRHSSLAAVQRVSISGVQGPQARAIDAALTDAARRMSTLDVNPGALRAAVAQFPVVREVRASASFPHGLRISVVEQLPVAVLAAGGVRTTAAADGAVLGPGLLSSSLPTISVAVLPAGRRVADPSLLASLSVLGAAPAQLARYIAGIFQGRRGLTVQMRNGLLAYFGDATLADAKWLSLQSVLADASSAGAIYVDVRVPSHPAAGFAPGHAPAFATSAPAASSQAGPSTSGESSAKPETPVSSLANGLAGGRETSGSRVGTESGSAPASQSTGAAPPSAAPQGGGSASGGAETPASGASSATIGASQAPAEAPAQTSPAPASESGGAASPEG